MASTQTQQPAKPSGYPEEQPKTNKKNDEPDAKTPHEPHNVPNQKPKP